MHAYEYFGGVTRLLVPDNLKTGVITNTRYDTVLNKSYAKWQNIMGRQLFLPVCATRRTSLCGRRCQTDIPKDSCPASQQKVLLRHEANEAVAVQLEVLNTTPFQKREGCRKSAFEQDEKEFLRPLPTMQYEPATWLKAKSLRTILFQTERTSTPYPLT
jgi:hypothetical protein